MRYIEKVNQSILSEMMKQENVDGFAQILDERGHDISALLDLATDVTMPELSDADVEKRKKISGFLFGRYVDLVIGDDNSVRTEQSTYAEEATASNFYHIADSILNYLLHQGLDLKSALSEKQLQGILDTIVLETSNLKAKSDSDYVTIDDQLDIIEDLEEKVDEILTEKKMVRLFGEVEGIVKEMLESPEGGNKDIEQIRTLRKDAGTIDFNKMLELMEPLKRLIKHPQFGQELDKILQDIGGLIGFRAPDQAGQEETQKSPDPSLTLPDVIGNEDSLNPILDVLTDEEIQKIMTESLGESPEETAERLRKEEEERIKLAQQNSNTNHYNHNSTSQELDQTKIAAISLKMAGALAIALGLGGPAGLILAALFLIGTKNIANGKEVNYNSPPNHTENVQSPANNEMMKQLFQSAQGLSAQGAITNGGEEAARVAIGVQGDLQESHEQPLIDVKSKIGNVNAGKSEIDERTEATIAQNSGLENTHGSNGDSKGHQTSR